MNSGNFSQSAVVSAVNELTYLKNEEEQLFKMLKLLKQQKTKLQIEELNLKSSFRQNEINNIMDVGDDVVISDSDKNKAGSSTKPPKLELSVTKTLEALASGKYIEEEEEEEEYDSDDD